MAKRSTGLKRIGAAFLLAGAISACAPLPPPGPPGPPGPPPPRSGPPGSALPPPVLPSPADERPPIPPGAPGGQATTPATQQYADAGVVVTPDAERPTSPDADPRSASQRAADVRAWDQCVSRASSRMEGPGAGSSPVSDNPEEACSRSLGMSSRNAPPDRRR